MTVADLKPKLLSWLAFILILQSGLLHLVTAQTQYEKAAYLGYLFAANFFGSLIAGFGIYYRQFWGWRLGLIITTGSIAGFIWSRTLGLPGINVEEWYAPYGIVSASVEAAFILIALLRPWKTTSAELTVSISARFPYVPHMATVLVISIIGLITYQWNASVIRAYGHHVGSLDQVCSTPVTTFDDLEKNYGLRVSLVAISMLDSIVDVRLKVVDPNKAHAILQNQAALLVSQQSLVLAPHMHSHAGPRLKGGKIVSIFFPTQQKIQRGSVVSLVFGSVRVESVVVR